MVENFVEVKKIAVNLPKAAFQPGVRQRGLDIKVGTSREVIHEFFLDTRAYYTECLPPRSRFPKRYHFSILPCGHPRGGAWEAVAMEKFKQEPIITVEMEHDKVKTIMIRKPFSPFK